ncbi:MAG: hypothetical protein H5T98_01590 [Syntrophomonadaceae bacterium]|nr:hypothetical protein [Syntrophomonadaceae bacterium]
MLIIVSNWKKKALKLLVVAVLLMAFVATVPILAGTIYRQVPVLSNWFQEEQPTGNPLRVEEKQDSSKFDQVLDQLVVKLQDFYREN